jgi:PadR family transcriptional regulator, regulatory protein PadR
MPKCQNDKLQGTLTLLILQTLNKGGPSHGYGLCEQIRLTSDELLHVQEGSLYPALRRMEQDEWLNSQWKVTDRGRPVRVFSITAKGKKQLVEENRSWLRLTEGVMRVLNA